MSEHVSDHEFYSARREYSLGRLGALSRDLEAAIAQIGLPPTTIFAAGSYGRLEASPYSDIDVFFLTTASKSDYTKSAKSELLRRTRNVVVDHGLPDPTPQFLKLCYLGSVLEEIGGPKEDHRNYFTLRLLMLLESRPLIGHEVYNRAIEDFLDVYFRDEDDHVDSFRPRFFTNEIERYWHTLISNYEHRRNPHGSQSKGPASDAVRRLKLKFSRLTTCFATIASLNGPGADGKTSAEIAKHLTSLTPLDRLDSLCDTVPVVEPHLATLRANYRFFLELTAKPTEEIEKFVYTTARDACFARAAAYHAQMVELLKTVSRAGDDTLFDYLAV